MFSAERFSPDEKCIPSARDILAANIHLLGAFHFDFYEKYYPGKQSDHQTSIELLSFGQVESTIISACRNTTYKPSHPESYRVKQFDLQTGHIRHWDVIDASHFSGSGDTLSRHLILEDIEDSSLTASLTLRSGIGNEWRSSTEAGLIGSSYWASYHAMHDLKLKEEELYEKIIMNEQLPRALGKSALTSE